MSDVSGTDAPTDAPVEDAPVEDAPIEDAPIEDAPVDVHALDAAHAGLLERFEASLGGSVLDHAPLFGTPVIRVRRDAWRAAGELARHTLECDYLSFIAGIDWMPSPREGDEAGGDTSAPVQPQETTYGVTGSDGRFQVFARVQSTRHHWGLILKADVDETALLVQSWVPVYPGADWHERECWEMYGFVFDGHPALRHLYLPSAFEGHPLRKDYPLLARVVKPWPGLVDVEAMPDEGPDDGETAIADNSETAAVATGDEGDVG